MGARFLRIYSSLFHIIGATTLVVDYRYLESGGAHLFNQVTLVLPQYILFEGSIFYILYIYIVLHTQPVIHIYIYNYIIIYYILSYHMIACHDMSCHVMSCHIKHICIHRQL